MIRVAGIAMLAAVTTVSQQSTPRVVVNSDAIEVILPAKVFRNEQVTKYLGSGLTTAIVVSAESGKIRGAFRIEIRYDLWDEVYRVTVRDSAGRQEQLTLASTEQLHEWLSTTHFRIAARSTPAPPAFSIEMKVVPFSASEQAEAQRWLLHSIHQAEARQSGGSTNADADPGAFDRMIAGSLQPKAVLSWHWKVPVSQP